MGNLEETTNFSSGASRRQAVLPKLDAGTLGVPNRKAVKSSSVVVWDSRGRRLESTDWVENRQEVNRRPDRHQAREVRICSRALGGWW